MILAIRAIAEIVGNATVALAFIAAAGCVFVASIPVFAAVAAWQVLRGVWW